MGYSELVKELSDRIVSAQREIRILDAIAWDESIEREFFEAGASELPRVDLDYYRKRSLRFDPAEKRAELQLLERDISSRLGTLSPLSQLMCRICREYVAVVDLLENRGLPRFSEISRQLYGSPSDVFHAGDPTLSDLARSLAQSLASIAREGALPTDEERISSEQAVAWLQERLDEAFAGTGHEIRVCLSDGVVADAAAGARTLKLRRDASFSERDLRVLEVHEGWAHLGTTFNGTRQSICTFLSKGPPSATVTQEGLAVLLEVASLSSHPARLRRISDRTRAIELAESGADFLDVYRFFLAEGKPPATSYQIAMRVFRGVLPSGGCFSKDLSYCKGFVQVYHFIQVAVSKGKLERIPLLFCGKSTLQDIPTLAALVEEGLVQSPSYLPPPIRDLSALAAWMCFARFFQELTPGRIDADYATLLAD